MFVVTVLYQLSWSSTTERLLRGNGMQGLHLLGLHFVGPDSNVCFEMDSLGCARKPAKLSVYFPSVEWSIPPYRAAVRKNGMNAPI